MPWWFLVGAVSGYLAADIVFVKRDQERRVRNFRIYLDNKKMKMRDGKWTFEDMQELDNKYFKTVEKSNGKVINYDIVSEMEKLRNYFK